MSRVFFALAPALLFVACQEPNSLTGSITDSHDLSFDSVQIRLLTDQDVYEVRYDKALDGGANDIVCKLVFDAPSSGITLDAQLDVIALDGRVERITAKNDPFPDIERADVTFTAGGTDDGDTTIGVWGATFTNGKTISGTFDAPLTHVSF